MFSNKKIFINRFRSWHHVYSKIYRITAEGEHRITADGSRRITAGSDY